jgi:hypothetical protein
MYPPAFGNHSHLRTFICSLLLAAFALSQAGCELNGLDGRIHVPAQTHAERAALENDATDVSLSEESQDAELQEAALDRVQELLAADTQDQGSSAGETGTSARPVRLSTVFLALSNQARRFGGRLLVP